MCAIASRSFIYISILSFVLFLTLPLPLCAVVLRTYTFNGALCARVCRTVSRFSQHNQCIAEWKMASIKCNDLTEEHNIAAPIWQSSPGAQSEYSNECFTERQWLLLNLWLVFRLFQVSTMQSANAHYYLFIRRVPVSRCDVRIAFCIRAGRIPTSRKHNLCIFTDATRLTAFSSCVRHIADPSGIAAPLAVAVLTPISDSVTRFSTFGCVDDIHLLQPLIRLQTISMAISMGALKPIRSIDARPLTKSYELSASCHWKYKSQSTLRVRVHQIERTKHRAIINNWTQILERARAYTHTFPRVRRRQNIHQSEQSLHQFDVNLEINILRLCHRTGEIDEEWKNEWKKIFVVHVCHIFIFLLSLSLCQHFCVFAIAQERSSCT